MTFLRLMPHTGPVEVTVHWQGPRNKECPNGFDAWLAQPWHGWQGSTIALVVGSQNMETPARLLVPKKRMGLLFQSKNKHF